MKKLITFVLLAATAALVAWSPRGAVNRPVSVVVDASSTSVPTAFSNAAGSLVLQNLVGKQYQHLKVLNLSKSPISVLTIPEVSSAPAASVTGQRLHVASGGSETFNDISIFDNLYIQSEDNAIAEDLIKINVW